MAEFQGLVDIDNLIDNIASKKLEVGFFEHSAYEDGTPVAGVASVQEFGSVANRIPPRPFFNPALESNEKKYAKLMAKNFEQVIEGNLTTEQALGQIGEFAKGDIQEGIRAVDSPPLSERTIAARAKKNSEGKASTKPLVDTGLMIQSVDYEVSDV